MERIKFGDSISAFQYMLFAGISIEMSKDKKTLYLFIDEGGNFDFSPIGSNYFILTCLVEERPFPSYDKLWDTRPIHWGRAFESLWERHIN